nr:unnamed protein product [Callosobruchus analis]
MTRLHDKYGKTLILHGPTGRMIISIDYDFLEFVLSTTSILNKSDEYSFLHQWLGSGLLTSDESSMGVSINAQEVEDSEYVKNVKLLCKIVAERQNRLRERFDAVYWLFPNYYREKRAVRKIHNFTYSVIDSRKKLLDECSPQQENDPESKKRVAFLDMLLQSTVDGRPLTREEIREEVDTFMLRYYNSVV